MRRHDFPRSLGNLTLGLVKAASGASKLREFELVALWTNELANEFHQGFPDVEIIRLHGSLDGFGPDGYELGEILNVSVSLRQGVTQFILHADVSTHLRERLKTFLTSRPSLKFPSLLFKIRN
jgi:hypothetical protein